MWGDACCLAERGSKTARTVNTYLVTASHPSAVNDNVLGSPRRMEDHHASRERGPAPAHHSSAMTNGHYVDGGMGAGDEKMVSTPSFGAPGGPGTASFVPPSGLEDDRGGGFLARPGTNSTQELSREDEQRGFVAQQEQWSSGAATSHKSAHFAYNPEVPISHGPPSISRDPHPSSGKSIVGMLNVSHVQHPDDRFSPAVRHTAGGASSSSSRAFVSPTGRASPRPRHANASLANLRNVRSDLKGGNAANARLAEAGAVHAQRLEEYLQKEVQKV